MIQGATLKSILLIVSLCAIGVSQAQEQSTDVAKDTFDIKDGSYLLPQRLKPGRYDQALAIYYVIVPKDWSLDNIQAPMFNYSGKYNLPRGFNIQANASTLIVSNRFSLGPFWNYSINNYHFGVGYQVAFNLGVLREFGFNTVLTGWEQQPSVTFGYSFKKSAITIRYDVYYTSALYLSEAGNVVSFTNVGRNGSSITASLEQRLWKNRVMSFGVKVNHIRYHILAWPAFPVNSYRYFVPEFQIGLRLLNKKMK